MQIKNLFIFSTTTLAITACGEKTSVDKPNIVIIMADDLLTSELSCYGGVNINTPNIARLAEEGVLFNHNYTSMAASVPIRASMYTGLYPVRNGAYQNQVSTYETTKSVTDYLPQCGYRVGRTGKSHFKSWTPNKFEQIAGCEGNCVKKEINTFDVNGIKEFMTRSEDPFVLYVCSSHPHTPWDSGDPAEFPADKITLPDFIGDTPKTRELYSNYLAEIRKLDNEVGGVYKVLEECGKLENTILFFLGEQGLEMPGGKYTVWHPGVQSAMIARYPEKIKAGTVCNAIVQYEDILPTMIDIAGGTVEEGQFDGVSFKNTLYGKESEHRDYAFGLWTNCPRAITPYSIRSVRNRDYVLIHNLHYNEYNFQQEGIMDINNPNPTHYGKVWQSWGENKDTPKIKFLYERYLTRPEYEFYDLKNDPYELNNLYGDNKYTERIASMKAEITEWMKQQNDPGKSLDVRRENFRGWEHQITKRSANTQAGLTVTLKK